MDTKTTEKAGPGGGQVDAVVIPETPCGVVALFLNKDGRVIAHTADFSHSVPGGFTMKEAQGIRARRSLAYAVIRELASPVLSDAIDNYEAERVVEAMCKNSGCRQITVPIGYEDQSV